MAAAKRLHAVAVAAMVAAMVVVLRSALMAEAQADLKNNGEAVLNQLDSGQFTQSGVADVVNAFASDFQARAHFCFLDGDTDWNRAFSYQNWSFLAECMKTQGDLPSRLCTEAEIKVYLDSLSASSYIGQNRNCNITSWISGCEPGWACSTGPDEDLRVKDEEIPARTSNCQACCKGFFCPQGLTCMIPCPLGSYCPLATLNETTGLCEPYLYGLPPGGNHTCGGANIWADLGRSDQVFCPAGSYCPTTTEKIPCNSGYYCRTGSTSETRCSRLISCDANTATQNIRTYGIMLIVALVALLLFIYNFSDQILAVRERRRAKYRERAAKSVQRKERVRARWKSATDAALKNAAKLHANLSRKFSQRKDAQELRILDEIDVMADDNLLSTCDPIDFDDYQPSSIGLEGDLRGSMGSEIVPGPIDGPHSHGRSSLEIESENTKKKISKTNGVNTDSQIFQYAYAQIEKERYLERKYENLTFSGVVSMATWDEIRKRPFVEVAFKDLTLMLKGNKRCILKSLTGKIMPGRIAAVMGPSGAGKTTFLSALAGKARGCTQGGLILINQKPKSIHSYKKIIGFVPQDDIVHGNLTVEENLWFSARCRLPAGMPRADKVLVVERVIMNLGLQEVRDSLVGTVEKRGISGGQRKRVNVGLEMVMEPSLLFLDEPTSGLDSSSSRLLLRALKHEALAGVNICMVVHQPSYSLFKMFDDLILLAKGGLMVYHGSVREVEGYFGGLGINVPQRVNPPDYYIDILEGLVEPDLSSGINFKDLPLRWMLHNQYPVPEDMQSRAVGLIHSQISTSESIDSTGDVQSFAGELWQDIRCNVEQQRDRMLHNFLRQKDLSNRRTPGVVLQYKYFLGRIAKQRLREAKLQATDYLILLIAGACLGAISKISDSNFGASGYSYTIIAISLLCQIAALRSFSLDKLQYLRESASGISSLAHFLAKDSIDHFNTLIKPAVYLSMFYFLTNPRSTFIDHYIVLVCLVYCVTGIGYVFAIFFQPGSAQLFSVLFPVCFTLIATKAVENDGLKIIAQLTYPKWALEALVIANAKRYYGVWLINRCGVLKTMGYDLHAWKTCILVLIMFGVASRVIAFIGLLIIRKK